MQINITLDPNDIAKALDSYIRQHTSLPEGDEIDIELIPAKGTAGPSAVVSIKEAAVPAPVSKPAATASNDDNDEDGTYDDMGRDAILALCQDRDIPIRSDGAKKDKRTTVLIRELESWDETNAVQPVEEAAPVETDEAIFEEQTVDPVAEEESLFDDAATETGVADHLFGAVTDPVEEEMEAAEAEPVEEPSVESLFG